MKKTIGIIGGMGPMATCDLMKKIIDASVVEKDQDYVRIVVDSNTEIPDRTRAILYGEADPTPELIRSAKRLESIGADELVISCNTAHYFAERIMPHISIPIIHMPDETAKLLKEKGVKKAAIMATDGTIKSGVYSQALERWGIQPIIPSPEDQAIIMTVIYDYVKAGRQDYQDLHIEAIVDRLHQAGAEYVIQGCTELPLVFEKLGITEGSIDATSVLAVKALEALDIPVSEAALAKL